MDTVSETPIYVRDLPRKVAERVAQLQKQTSQVASTTQEAPENLTLKMSPEDAILHLTKQKQSLRNPLIQNAYPNMSIADLERYYDEQIAMIRQRAQQGASYEHVLELHNAAQKAINAYAETLAEKR